MQIDLKLPKGILSEKVSIKYEDLTLTGASTPPTEQIMLFAQKHVLPVDLNIEATLTYQQIKDSSKQTGGTLLRTSCSSVKVPSSFFIRIIEPTKDNQDCKI